MYTNLARYFDVIFPVAVTQLDFIEEYIQKAGGQTVLDAACGSGGYSIELAKRGYRAIGIDLDPGMITYAREKAYQLELDVKFRIEDLRCMSEGDHTVSAVICIGNSLPHLLHDEDIQQALTEIRRVLRPGGVFILQTVNYDYVLQERPGGLPEIYDEEHRIHFTRKYTYRDDGLIDFTTCLKIQDDEEHEQEYGGTIPLRPLVQAELATWLVKTGFTDLAFYGGFEKRLHNADSCYTVVVATVN